MPKATVTPKVPGESPEAEHVAVVPDSGSVPASAEEETIAVPKAVFDALTARLDNLEASAAKSSVSAKRANPEADLPDQDSIDLETLKSPVLTKQGWLVPETFGSHPNAKKL